jgi:hypothetical protein
MRSLLHIVSLKLKFVFLLLLGAYTLAAQSLQVFSELQRVDPSGQILALDRSPSPRELISPAAARNSFISFHVAVSVPPGQTYFLYTQDNPPGILKLQLYKEQFVNEHGTWIPDTLTATGNPSFGVIPDAQSGIADQSSRDYLLDVWVPPDAEVGRRVRVEVLLKYGTWTIVPMEVRIVDAFVRTPRNPVAASLPAIDEPADAAAVHALASRLAGVNEWNGNEPIFTVRQILRRNAQQDMSLASNDPVIAPSLWLRAASQIVNGWTLFPNGAEWYLRVRDLVISRPRR